MATLKDIAKKSECSVSLVSRVLNPNASVKVRVSREKRQKIQDAAKALGFMRNVNARYLRQGRTAAIGVFLPYSRSSILCDLNIGIGNAAMRLNFPINSYYGVAMECFPKFLELNLSVASTGIVSYPHPIMNDLSGQTIKLLRKYLDKGGFAVFTHYLDDLPKELSDVTLVNSDNEHSGTLAATRLLEAGCNEFIVNTDSQAIENNEGYVRLRYRGFAQQVNSGNLHEVVSTEQVAEMIKHALDKGRSPGVFSLSDREALRVIKACGERYRLEAGRDYKIIGCDNQFLSDYLAPGLTTIEQNFNSIGEIAIEKLVKMITTGKREESIKIKPKLVARETA